MINTRRNRCRRFSSVFDRRRRLHVETLEDRRLLAAMTDGTETLVNDFTTGTQVTRAETRAVDGNASGEFAVVFDGWGPDGFQEIYLRRFDATSTPIGSQQLVNVTTNSNQRYPSVAMGAGGESVVAWSGPGAGDNDGGVFVRLYDNTGTPATGEIRVNQTTASGQQKPVVAKANDGSFIVTWSGNGVGDSVGVFARRFAANGIPLTGEFRVNTTTLQYQQHPDVAIANDGSSVITWDGTGPGDAYGIFFQRYNSAGSPVGPETRVNTTLSGQQLQPSVGIDGANNFLITWNGYGAGDSRGVFGQPYNASGTPVGGETLINSTTLYDQEDASVGMAASGLAVVTWTSIYQDGSVRGVIGREFQLGAGPIGGEFIVNTTTSADQRYSSVGMRGDSKFTVAWSGRGTQPGNTDYQGVFIQSYSRNQDPTANDDVLTIIEDNPPFVGNGDVTANDFDPDFDPLTVTEVNGSPANVGVLQNGTYSSATIQSTGLYSYTVNNGSAAVQGLGPGQTVTDSYSYKIDDGNGGTDTAALVINVEGINDAPTFTAGPNESVLEDAGSQSVPGWATGIDDGDAAVTQGLSFNITGNTNPGLFAAGPAVSASGDLTYTPAANANGSAVITLELQDDGGTANGGADTSPPQQFTISVTPVNDVPSFTAGADESVLEDAGLQTVPGWATGISAGPPDEAGQTLTFNITGNTNPGLFAAGPAVDSSGQLTYTPADNANGSAVITLELMDNGGTANGGVDTSPSQQFTISVTAVNDVPSFTKGPNQSVLNSVGPQTVNPWATGISAGPPDESGQTLSFNITGNTDMSLFSAQPAVSSSGVLTYTPQAGANGTATITLNIMDNGGTANGGVDTSASQSFDIQIIGVQPPVAVDDAYSALGNVGLTVPAAGGVILGAGADNDGNGTITVTAVQGVPANVGVATSTNAAGLGGVFGSVTLAADGSFTYQPPPGYVGADTFTYEITNSAGSDTATVTITMSDMIWFIDNSSGGSNRGTLSNPFTSIGSFNSAQGASAPNATDGNTIYVEHTGTDYTTGITLRDSQILIGEGAGASIETISSLTLPSFSDSLPTTGGTAPVLTDTDPGDDGINLASSNTVRGLDIGNTGGTGISGSDVGTLFIREVGISSPGGGVDLSSVAGSSIDVVLDSLSASSSTDEGIQLNNVSGDFDITATTGTITGTGIAGVDITGDSAASKIDLGITLRSVSSSFTATGINLTDTTGSFTITGDGTNAQNASGGTISNTTDHGIVLTRTANFSASSLDLDSPGDTLAEHGLLATDIGGTNLFRGGRVTGIGHDSGDGIRIANTNTNLTLFEINNTLFNGTTTGGNDGVIVESLGSSVMRVDILNGSEFDSLRGDGVQANSAGTSNLTINLKNSNFNTDNGGADGGLAGGTSRITFISADSSTLTTVVEDNVIDDTGTQFGQLPVSSSIGVLDYIANDSSSLIARVRRNDISGVDQEQAIRVVGDDNAAALDVIIDDNDIDNIENENAIFVYIRDSTQLANISIINNDIGTGPDGAVGGGDDQPIAEHGIELRVQSRNIPPNANDAITANVLISGNDIVNSDSGSETIDLESEVDNPDGTSSDPGATLNATVTGNNLQNLGGGDELEADSEDGVQTGNLHGRSLLCLNMSGNTLDAGAGTMVVDEDGGTAQDAILNIVQTSQANLASANGIPTGNVTVAGTPNFSAAACATPTHGSPLTAAGGQGPGAAASLTTAQLSVIVDEASSRFSATGLSAAQTQLLQSVSVAIVDLADGRLGEAFGMTISIDVDAAGYGWFVDATPDDDSEFDADGQAITEEAAQGMDLLTVVMHELGHILGLDHAADGLMAEALTLGTRSADAHDEVFSDQTW